MKRGWSLKRLAVAATAVALAAAGSVPAAGQELGGRAAAAGALSIVAGGVGGPGKATLVSLDARGVSRIGGQTFITGGGSVRLLNEANDWLTTPVGGQVYSMAGAGALAADAALSEAQQATADHYGNMVIADRGGGRVWVVAHRTGTFYGQAMTAHHIYSVAGGGNAKYSGAPVAKAYILPEGVAVDHTGNLVVSDDLRGLRVIAVRRGTFYGQPMAAGRKIGRASCRERV